VCFLCNFSYEYDTKTVRKEIRVIQLIVLAHELLMSKVFTLTLRGGRGEGRGGGWDGSYL
jgi:hypothetical protein